MAETNKQKRDRVQKQVYWQEHIERWSESALSASGYCQEHVLSLSQFKYWQERLTTMQSPLFVEVETSRYQAYNAPSAERTLMIETPMGVKITLQTHDVQSDVACVLHVLSTSAC